MLYQSMGRFFPHRSHKPLILLISGTNSSESGLFNGLRRKKGKKFPSPFGSAGVSQDARSILLLGMV
jgi:hypothetical protein